MRRLRGCWMWPLAGAALVASALVGQAGAVPHRQAGEIPGLPPATDLQCPSTTLCLGIAGDRVDVPGPNLVMSRAPRSGKWVMENIGGGRRLRVLTCRSARWCLAVDQQNRVLISTDPAGRSQLAAGAGRSRSAPGQRAAAVVPERAFVRWAGGPLCGQLSRAAARRNGMEPAVGQPGRAGVYR